MMAAEDIVKGQPPMEQSLCDQGVEVFIPVEVADWKNKKPWR
jgi:hypothetical protein